MELPVERTVGYRGWSRFAIVVGLLAAACGGKSAPPAAPIDWTAHGAALEKRPPFVAPGERASYRVTAYNMTLAALSLAVGEPTSLNGRRAIVLQAEAQSVGLVATVKKVKAEFTSWVDMETGEPLLFRAVESAGKDDDTIEAVEARFSELADGGYPIVTTRPDTGEQVERQVAQGAPVEILTFLMSLRAWDGPDGARRVMDTVRSRYVWRTNVTLVGREPLVTELGQLQSVHFDAVTQRLMRDGTIDKGTAPRKFSVWISDDADRVPLLMVAETDYGDIRLEIAEYVEGTAPNLAH